MKKLLTILVCAVIAFSFGYSAIGAIVEGSRVETYHVGTGKKSVIEVLYTCTASPATFTATTMSNSLFSMVKGWVLDEVSIDGNHTGTEPTEDTDFYLYRDYNATPGEFDILGGNGVDQVDNTASRVVVPSSGGQNKWQYITSPLTLYLSGNAVTSATCYIKLRFVNPYVN